jgi:methanogenic corrinoid protein MtbC1
MQELPDTGKAPTKPHPLESRALVRERPLIGAPAIERTIKMEIIPRLVLRRREMAAPAARVAGCSAIMASERIGELTTLVLTRSEDLVLDYVEEVRLQGASIERLYLDLIGPVARHLGDLWCDDVCSFTDVTIGLWRLQHVVRSLSPLFQQDAARQLQHQALLIPLPGEHHTLGLSIVAEFFRRAGWNAWSMPLQSTNDLIAVLRAEWFTIIGLSLSCESRLDDLASQIRIIRRESCNQGIGVMVGGAIFIQHPELVAQVGADLMAIDGRQAPASANEFVSRQ